MAKNDFKPFATAANANVTAQADWETLPALLSGFTAGKASSAQVNKAIRQASFIAAALAQYTANKSGQDVLDNGDLNGFITKMTTAFGKDFQALDATLTALAGLATGANKLPYFTGTDTAAQTNLTSVGRDIIGKNTIADILTYLGLGEIALAGICAGVFSSSGYISIPAIIGGTKKTLYIQWGGGSTGSDGTFTVTFPIAFPEAAVRGFVTNLASNAPSGFGGIGTFTKTTAKIFSASSSGTANSSGVSYHYLVIGY